MVVFPNAKINLGLNIVEKRKDGYHNISSCFYPIKWCDILEVVESKVFEFNYTGNRIPGKENLNLCVKAYNIFKKDYQLPNVKIHLHKILPIGSGLGGGSSNGSYMLKVLNELFQLFLEDRILELYAEQLGSDCPFFITNQPVIAGGKGENLEPASINLSQYQLVIIFPGIDIDTSQAYKNISPVTPERSIKDIITNIPPEKWKEFLKNDFENGIFSQYPEIENIKKELYKMGAIYASMSGSGSSIYGIFKNQADIGVFKKKYTVWIESL